MPKGDVSRETSTCESFDVSRETRERLTLFAELLLRWNARINLIGRADEPLLWSRHIADSLQLRCLVPPFIKRAVDLGSGAGFPGLILAIATNIPFDLVEADSRKAAFLREAARQTAAPATVHVARIEKLRLRQAQLVTARALAPLPVLLDLSFPLLEHGGMCLFPKGGTVDEELTAARATWNMRVERHQSRLDPQGCILGISEVSRV